MKLQKQLSRKVRGVEYQKWVITLPKEIVESVNWGPGKELEATVENGKIILKAKK